MNGIAKMLFAVAFIVALGAASTAIAHGGGYGPGGPGYGHMMGPGYGPHMMGPGYGPHMMGPGMMGYGPYGGWQGDRDRWGGNLTREQAEQLENERESFYQETRELRDRIDDRYGELQAELSRENPDQKQVMELQKSLSTLEGELDQRRLEFQLEARKIAPEFGRFAAGYGPGGGYCW